MRKVLLLFLLLTVMLICIVAAFGWIWIPLTSERVNHYFLAAYPDHDVHFETGRLTWKPGRRTVDLHLQGVSILAGSGNKVACVPTVIVELEQFSVLQGTPQANVIRLDKPLIWLERTAVGAFNISIGTAERGTPGSLVRIILTKLVKSSPGAALNGTIPEIQLRDARLNLLDERSGARFAFDPVSLVIDTLDESVRAEATIHARTLGENLGVALIAVLDTKDGSVRIDAKFGNVNPAILSELLPNLRILNPIEIALHGEVMALLNPDLTLRSAAMSVQGGPGSLEVAQYSGSNVALKRLRADVSYAHDTGAFEIDDIWMDLGASRLTGTLSSTPASPELLNLRGDLMLSDNSWSMLMPTWFSALGRFDTGLGFNTTHAGISQRLRFEASLAGETRRLQGRGMLDFGFSNAEQIPMLNRLQATLPTDLHIFIDGTIAKPEISFGTP